MSWGPISAAANTPAKLEDAVKNAAKEYFDGIEGFSELDDKGGRQQARAAGSAARALSEALDLEGMVQVNASGHVRRGEPGAVPSGVSITLIELNPPHIEHENVENSENDENSTENGEN